MQITKKQKPNNTQKMLQQYSCKYTNGGLLYIHTKPFVVCPNEANCTKTTERGYPNVGVGIS